MTDSRAIPAADEGLEDELLSQQPDQIAGRGATVGRERLGRSLPDMAVTAFIGGVEVALGAVAAMLVLGASMLAAPQLGLYGGLALAGLVFPSGLLFVVVGRSELFTENFLIPVIGVLSQRGSAPRLAALWGLSLVGNLAGCAVMAALISVPHAVGAPIMRGFTAYTNYKLAMPVPSLLVSAILAGATMTVLTWLLLAIPDAVGKALVIWAAGYVLFATNMSHVVVSSAIIFVGAAVGHRGPIDVARYIGVATLGNLVGGLGLITCFRLAQVWEKQRSRANLSDRR